MFMEHKDINKYIPKAVFVSGSLNLAIASAEESYRREKLKSAYDDLEKAFDQYKRDIYRNEQLRLQSYPRKIRNQLKRKDLA